MFDPRDSAYAVNLTYDNTHIYTYISCEISIEHPSVGLASLAQQIRYAQRATDLFIYILYVYVLMEVRGLRLKL